MNLHKKKQWIANKTVILTYEQSNVIKIVILTYDQLA
jgi:hypothetical protein